MKITITILLVLSFNLNIYSQIKTSELNPEEYYDFWIGEWDLTWEKADGTVGKGENFIFKTLSNKVIEENFSVVDDASLNGFTGKSWSVYNTNNNIWYQTWVDNQGSYLDFIGEFKDDKRIFKREIDRKDGKNIIQQMVFYDIKENSFTWDWEISNDGGKTWNLKWRINYKRKGAS